MVQLSTVKENFSHSLQIGTCVFFFSCSITMQHIPQGFPYSWAWVAGIIDRAPTTVGCTLQSSRKEQEKKLKRVLKELLFHLDREACSHSQAEKGRIERKKRKLKKIGNTLVQTKACASFKGEWERIQ